MTINFPTYNTVGSISLKRVRIFELMLNGNFHLVWAVAAAYTFQFKNENMDRTAQKDDNKRW